MEANDGMAALRNMNAKAKELTGIPIRVQRSAEHAYGRAVYGYDWV